jgi:salicylate hydroxylase
LAKTQKINIVGAGLGGLAAAIALRRKGFDVAVYEQADALGEIGAGVQLGPNGTNVLRALDLESEVLSLAFEPDRHVARSWKSGRELFATQMRGIFPERFGSRYLQVHRADLHRVLQRALPPECIHLAHACVEVRTENQQAILRFEDGSEVEGDVAIGADGIHSSVRASMFGTQPPRFTGNVCWRGIVPASSLPKGLIPPDATIWLGPRGHVVHYYVRGGELINYVASVEADDWRSESWSVQVDRQEVLNAYKGWNSKLLELFAHSERCYKWALFDRDPLPQWTQGRATLLGDAAHPMLPYLAQGASQAIEDGYELATSLANHPDDAPQALIDYENIRRPRTSRVQLTARGRAKTNHLNTRLQRLRRDLALTWRKWTRPNSNTYDIDWIYGYDATGTGTKKRSPAMRGSLSISEDERC